MRNAKQGEQTSRRGRETHEASSPRRIPLVNCLAARRTVVRLERKTTGKKIAFSSSGSTGALEQGHPILYVSSGRRLLRRTGVILFPAELMERTRIARPPPRPTAMRGRAHLERYDATGIYFLSRLFLSHSLLFPSTFSYPPSRVLLEANCEIK